MEAETKKRAEGHSRGHSLFDDFQLRYDTAQIAQLTQEILDGTVHDNLLALFSIWVCEKPENYEEARKYIRELGLDQDYQTSRIANEKLRKLVSDAFEFRPKYVPPVPEEGEEMQTLLEILQESPPVMPKQKQKRSLTRPSRISLRSPLISTLRKKSGVLRTLSDGFNQGSPVISPGVESHMFESQVMSPVASPSPLQARAASTRVGSSPSLKKKKSMSTKSMANTVRSASQEYPPNTPDRPAPLNLKSRTEPSFNPATSRSVSTPVRRRYDIVSPLTPQGLSPPPPLPPIPSPLRSAVRQPSLFHLFPQPYQTPRRNPTTGRQAEAFGRRRGYTATRKSPFETTAREVEDATATDADSSFVSQTGYQLKLHEHGSSDSSSTYSEIQEPMHYNKIANKGCIVDRQDSLTEHDVVAPTSLRASHADDDDDADWSTVTDQNDEQKDLNRKSSSHHERGLTYTNVGPQEERVHSSIESAHQNERAPSSSTDASTKPLLETAERSTDSDQQARPRKGKVTLAERRSAQQASQEAREANLAAMSGFHRPLPLRSYESQAFPAMKAKGARDRVRSNSMTVSTGLHCPPLLPVALPVSFGGQGVKGVLGGEVGGEGGVEVEEESDVEEDAVEHGEQLVAELEQFELVEDVRQMDRIRGELRALEERRGWRWVDEMLGRAK